MRIKNVALVINSRSERRSDKLLKLKYKAKWKFTKAHIK